MDTAKRNFTLVGLGGQGILTLARLITEAAAASDQEVSGFQSFRPAIRGGSVQMQIAIGSTRCLPSTPAGEVDVVVGLESLEAARAAYGSLRADGWALVNRYSVPPIGRVLNLQPFPTLDAHWHELERGGAHIIWLDANGLALQAGGSLQSANIVMLGALAGLGLLPCRLEALPLLLERRFPKRYEASLRCFEAGMAATQALPTARVA